MTRKILPPLPERGVSWNYDEFVLQEKGNRRISETKVTKLEKSFQEHDDGDLNECLCAGYTKNGKKIIVGHRHSFVARKRLGLPIFWVLKSGITLERVLRMDLNQWKWNVEDCVYSNATLGLQDYIDLMNFTIANGINYEASVRLTTKNYSDYYLRRGKYVFDNRPHAETVMEVKNYLAKMGYEKPTNGRCLVAISQVIECKGFKMKHFLRRLHKYLHLIPPGGSWSDFSKCFIKLYNEGIAEKNRISLLRSYTAR